MKKKTIKLSESQLRKMIAEAIENETNYPHLKRTKVNNPIGYLTCREYVAEKIYKNGFKSVMHGNNSNSILGPGMYFSTEPLHEPKYGNCIIKVQANGVFDAYISNHYQTTIFVVRPEDCGKIQILDDNSGYDGGDVQKQMSDMYRDYGNRSIGDGVRHEDDAYDVNNSGSLAMQAMKEPDSYENTLYRNNGQNSHWASPKGDFTTKRISESQLRNMIDEAIKKALKEQI